MASENAHACLGCGKVTTAKCQICDQCLGMRRYKTEEKRNASAEGPETQLRHECDSDYSEDALGPHTSDERWSWVYVEDDWL